METRKLGSLEVTIVGLGTNNFGMGMEADDVPPVVDAAIEAGINFFDTADSYGDSEDRLGRALGRRRERVVIATKFGNPVGGQAETGGARPEYVRRALEASLRRLGTDYIDLYQLHKPDPDTPIADTLGALADAVKAGFVREIGCSNFSAAQLREAREATGDGPYFVSVQNRYNLINREDEIEVIPECERQGIVHLPYFPLASGLLTGKYKRGEDPPVGTRLHRWGPAASRMFDDATFDKVEAAASWAEAHGHTLLETAMGWLLARPAVVSAIAGATSVEQLRANIEATRTRLTVDEIVTLDAVTAGQ